MGFWPVRCSTGPFACSVRTWTARSTLVAGSALSCSRGGGSPSSPLSFEGSAKGACSVPSAKSGSSCFQPRLSLEVASKAVALPALRECPASGFFLLLMGLLGCPLFGMVAMYDSED